MINGGEKHSRGLFNTESWYGDIHLHRERDQMNNMEVMQIMFNVAFGGVYIEIYLLPTVMLLQKQRSTSF